MLSLLVFLWGIPAIKSALNRVTISIPVPGLHLQVVRVPPVVAPPAPDKPTAPEKAVKIDQTLIKTRPDRTGSLTFHAHIVIRKGEGGDPPLREHRV